jgi:ABC-2 type transport system ATP-binding protein
LASQPAAKPEPSSTCHNLDAPIIEAVELSRWYGIVMGLNNVSFEIGSGLTGLVGPNGAGKSTLIQIITGQLQPSSGTLTVFGERPWNNPNLLLQVGYVPEGEAVPKDLRPLDWLRGLARLSGMSAADAAAHAKAILDRVRLPREHWQKRMGQYSKGMKQRVKLAQGLIHRPGLLVLDEPMNGLDPMGRQEMANLLKQLAANGVNILISSHILAELEALCKNILILNWGRILASGSQKEIRSDVKNWSEELTVHCDAPEKLARHLFDAGVLLGFDLDREGLLQIRVKDAPSFYSRWTTLLLESQVTVHSIRSQSRSLKNIFDKVTT